MNYVRNADTFPKPLSLNYYFCPLTSLNIMQITFRISKLFPLLFFILVRQISLSQNIQSFTADNTKFLTDMQAFLAETNKKEAEKFMEDVFIPLWNSGKISDSQKQQVYATSNAMLKRRLKAFPDFKNYLIALKGIVESNQSSQSFDNWHKSIVKMLKGTTRRFGDYLEICNDLFNSNILYQSATTRWSSNNNAYTFDFDTLPKIIFSGLNLTCNAKSDSSVIYNTKGVYYPNLRLFYGSGGRVNWSRAGLPESDVYADVKNYIIDITGSDYVMDSVTFYYPMFFSQPLKGRFTEKILVNVTVETATYPRFSSYDLNLSIKELIRDANYKGGFSLHGTKMVGSGNKKEDAYLTFLIEGKPMLVLASKSFVIRPERVVSDKASATIYWEKDGRKDSIYHSDIEFKYLTKEHELTLLRNTQSNSSAPFYDSYHQVDMYFDALNWKITDPIMDIKMVSGGAESKMTFESSNYYSDQRFQKIQGIQEMSPLATLKKYAEKTGSRVIYTQDLASDMRISDTQIRNLLIWLSGMGMVAYDSDEDRAILKDRLYYYLKANTGKVDYDIIQFESMISGKPNASINLLNFEINMRGVSRVVISDTQNVYIVPNEQELTLKNNRDFTFGGRVHSGYLDFFGKSFDFNYEKFKLDLHGVDSLRLRILSDSVDEKGKFAKIPLRSLIQNLNGILYIDRADNKSGFQKTPEFPVLESIQESFVYYEYKHIFDSIYRKDKFYFKLDPFTLDSLDNYSKEGIAFNGIFASADIFQPMRETLIIQPDLSLGFTRTTQPEGLTAYSGKGTYHDHLSLSHRGLRGNGQIDYLTSISHSSDIKFFPDSANYDATDFEIQKRLFGNVNFPHVKAVDVYINWQPKQDKMFVFKKTKDMDLYDGKAFLDGNLILASKGVNANGRISFEQAELLSNNFYINQGNFGADTSDFFLKSSLDSLPALSTKNMKSKINLDTRVGEFASNGSGSYVNFPLNQYICFIEQFKWYFDKKDIQLIASAKSKSVEGSEFVSIHPGQDSLRFFSPDANYSMSDYFIRAKKIRQVLVADASVIPDSGIVVIEKGALMQTLNNSTVVADTASKFHTILNASVNITSRKNYSGTGDYSYTDMAKVKHLVHLSQIAVDTSRQTFANGEIPEDLNFSLAPNIQYKGKVSLHASDKNLFFTGLARLNHGCELIEKNWFSFSSRIDPSGVSIPVMNPKNETGDKVSVSIYFSADSSDINAAFLSPKMRNSDKEIISANGLLTYDPATKFYTVKDTSQSKDNLNAGNTITLDDRKCIVYGEGNLSFDVEFGQFKLRPIGNVTNDLQRNTAEFDVVLDMDFLFSDDALKVMQEMVLFQPSLSPTNDNRPVYTSALTALLGKEKSKKLIGDINLYGKPKKLPEEIQHSFVLTDVKLYWDKERQTIRSKGDIGIGFTDKWVINRMVRGFIEIQKKRSGDAFNFYFETDPSTWYYFNYQRGVMQVISSESKFNDIIVNMKEEKRIADEKDGKAPYQYMLSTERKKNEFLKRFNETEE